MPTDSHYSLALREIVDKQVNEGLFSRCFAETSGDETKTKALYIKLRAKQIEEQEIIEKEKQEIERKKQEKEFEKYKKENFELFKSSYTGEIPLHYYNHSQQQAIYEEWLKKNGIKAP